MKFGVPWSVKGIRPEARETAKEAARRSGMPLGEWLNSVILEQAADLHDDEDSYGEDMSSVHERLDDITRRLDQFSRKGPEAYAPRRQRQAAPQAQNYAPPQANPGNDQLAQLIARLDQRIEQLAALPRMMAPYAPPLPQQPPQPAWAPQPMPAPAMQPQPAMRPPMAPPAPPPMPFGLDRAVAEIAARQRSLNGAPAQGQPAFQPAPQPAQPPMPQAVTAPAFMPQQIPAQDISGLEDRLRQITDQIETLRRPGVEDAINALRAELSDINRALADAMPRQAIDAIERQIQGLTQRIAEGRQNGGDHGALSGIEHGLAEVRDALRGLTPAENLVGFNDAVEGLAHKIDMIVARRDPETLGQLEHAITTLRDMAEHVASNEAVGRLAAQVAELGDKVDHFAMGGASDALNNLEHRISALSDALAARSQNGAVVPPRLEALVESLSDKIEQIQQSRGDNVAVGHLENQIVALVQRLDASDSRLGHLEAIERGLGDLLVHIQELRADKNPSGLRDGNPPEVANLQQQLARTQSALDAMHGTLGIVVDRLATIEKGVREPRTAAFDDAMELTEPVGRIASRVIVDEPAAPAPREMNAPLPNLAASRPQVQPAPELAAALAPKPALRPAPAPAPQAAQPQAKRLPPAPRLPINPELPPDQPLEPGSVPPRFGGNPAARIAASEAALAGIKPHADASPTGKSGFIAAARRAAQAAMETAKPRAPRADEIEALTETDAPSPLRASIFKKIKQVLIAASLVAIVIGGIQFASTFLHLGGSNSRTAQDAPAGIARTPADDNGAAVPQPPATDDALVTHSVTAPAKPLDLPGYLMGPSGTIRNVTPGAAPRDDSSSLLSAPSLNPPPTTSAPNADVTGSIGPKAKPAAPQVDGGLPVTIGSDKLREAAAAGDAGAAFEIAQRFAEGRGVAASAEEAARWYERAAGKGLPLAQFRYASMLEKGQGVKKNLGQARKLYVAAAGKGYAKAMHNLAVLYAEGIDGKPDYGTAAQWFRKAADYGVGDSQYNLGILCARGLGVEKNLGEAYQWFSLAAAQGDHEAGRKRDEIGGRLEPDELTAAQDAVKAFKPQEQPAAATAVPMPRGGWDATSNAEPAAPKAHVKPRAVPQAVTGNSPLNIGVVARR